MISQAKTSFEEVRDIVPTRIGNEKDNGDDDSLRVALFRSPVPCEITCDELELLVSRAIEVGVPLDATLFVRLG